jgi:hypothetical protein
VFDFLFELLIQIVIEGIGQVLIEGLFELGLEATVDSLQRERESRPIVAAIGHLLLGALAGVISLLAVPHRLAPRSFLPGLSVVLSPLANGIIMHAIGRRWDDRPSDRPGPFTFRAGVLFAFAMALVRFVWLR